MNFGVIYGLSAYGLGQQLNIDPAEARYELAGAAKTLGLRPKPFWLVEILLSDRSIPGGMDSAFQQVFEVFWMHGYEARTLDLQPVVREDVQRFISIATGGAHIGHTNFIFC